MIRFGVNWLRSAFFFAIPVFAAEQSGGETHHDMTPWLWANFLILIGALAYLGAKHGAPFLKARQESISSGIAEAAAKKADADRRVADVNQRLSALDSEIANLKTQMREEQAQEAQRLADRNAAELARIQHQAEQEMEAAGKAARIELQAHAAKLALDLAEQKLRAEMTGDTQQRLTRGFVESLR